MLKLFGWTGAGRELPAVKEYLKRSAGPSAAAIEPQAGEDWICYAGQVDSADGLVAAITGQPIWRTSDARILNATNSARALLEAYRIHGAKLLDVLYGSFAIVVIDSRRRTTLLAVDRMGVERLCYARQGESLWFANSAAVVARRPGSPAPRIRKQALLSYLFFHMIPSPETVFEDVRKIPPATAVVLEADRLTEQTYWLPRFATDGSGSYQELAESLHTALTTAVRVTQPDERTGAFLSGGLDSSTVAGFLSKVKSPEQATTFSIGFGFKDYDELDYARIARDRFGLKAIEYEVRPDDIVDLFPQIARAYDEPFGNASALPTLCCARLALEHGVTHLLAGDGGDEIFAGNKRYAEQQIFEHYGLIPKPLRTGLLEPFLRAVPNAVAFKVIRKARSYVAQANIGLPDRLENWNFLHRLGVDAILHPDFAGAIDTNAPLAHMRTVYNSAPPAGLVDRMMYYDWRFTLADNDLRKVGMMCDLAGVRVSYPMLHPDVVDVSVRVPPRLKMQGTQLRSFYKRAMGDFLPQEIINKKKHGFGLPFGLWLERSPRLAALIDANLASLGARRLIRPQFIEQLRKLHGQEDASYYGGFVWTLAMLEQWFQEQAITP